MASTRPTIYSVAARAGVSISTVSLALNHPDRVGAAARRRVLEAVDALGYRAGASRRTRTIAVAAPFAAFPSYYRRLDGILEVTHAPRVDVLVHDLPPTNMDPAPILDVLPVREDVDGIVVMGTPLSSEVEAAIERTGLPAVVVDVQGSALPSVVGADRRGGELIGSHLRDRGHERVWWVHETQASDEYVSAGMLRQEGLESRLAHVRSIAVDEGLPTHLDATAIAANNDALAARVLAELRSRGVRVPQDVAMTGYDDGDLAAGLDLTTVAQPFADSGRMAAHMLLGMMAGDGVALRTATIDVDLVVRGSTG